MFKHKKFDLEIKINTNNTITSIETILKILDKVDKQTYLKIKKEMDYIYSIKNKPNLLTKISNKYYCEFVKEDKDKIND